MRLLPVAPEDVHTYIDWLRPRLAIAIRKTGERDLPDVAWPMLRNRDAYLYVVEHAEELLGFFIFQQVRDPDGLCLYVYAMWLERGVGKVWEEQLWREVDSLKEACKAKRTRWKGRKGWASRAKVVSYVYER